MVTVRKDPQSSQRSSRFHKPAAPRAALGTATNFASTQQPADLFCKEIPSGQHRLEAPSLLHQQSNTPLLHQSIFVCSRSPTVETRRRERRQCRCNPCREHHFTEPKPQQTGTRLLIGHGEVATTSGSTSLRPRRRSGRRLPRRSPPRT